jgi:hypothetical protein
LNDSSRDAGIDADGVEKGPNFFPGDIMNTYSYRILTGAALALCVGLAGAQTYGQQSTTEDKNATQNMQAPAQNMQAPAANRSDTSSQSRLPANKGATENNTPAQVEPTPQATDKMSAQGSEMNTTQGSKMSGTKSTKTTHHASKTRSHSEQTAMKGDKAYQDALRSCAKEQDQGARDKCLDNAIEQFHRNT